jgi:hypothetical protein
LIGIKNCLSGSQFPKFAVLFPCLCDPICVGSVNVLARSLPAAAAIAGYRSVQSYPRRVNRRAAVPFNARGLRPLSGHPGSGVMSFELVDAGAKAEHRTYAPPHAHRGSDTACIEFIGDRLQFYRAVRADLRHDGGEFYCVCVGFHLARLRPDTPFRPKSIAGRPPPHAPSPLNAASHSQRTVWPPLGSGAQPCRLAGSGATAFARRWSARRGTQGRYPPGQSGPMAGRPTIEASMTRVSRPMEISNKSPPGTTDLAAGWSVAPGRGVLLSSERSPSVRSCLR